MFKTRKECATPVSQQSQNSWEIAVLTKAVADEKKYGGDYNLVLYKKSVLQIRLKHDLNACNECISQEMGISKKLWRGTWISSS